MGKHIVKRPHKAVVYDHVSGTFNGQEVRGSTLLSHQGKRYKAKRLAWLLATGREPEGHVVHIDRDERNNRFSNLADLTPSQEKRLQHRSRMDNCGVYRREHRWTVTIRVEGRNVHYGSFSSRAQAMRIAKEARAVRDVDIAEAFRRQQEGESGVVRPRQVG